MATARLASEIESDFLETLVYGMVQLVDFNVRKTQLVLSDHLNNCGAWDVKMDGSVLD